MNVTENGYAYLRELVEHKRLVGLYMTRAITALVGRAIVHDNSKLDPEELELYADAREELMRHEYGSEGYRNAFRAVKPALKHHFANNSHHPEFYLDGINDMDLFDVTEMVCDWMAACQRGGGTTLRLDLQRERFGISDQLYTIICRTAQRLKSLNGDKELEIVQ